MGFAASRAVSAAVDLEVLRMILLLFPTMATLALVLCCAPFFIGGDDVVSSPGFALVFVVEALRGFAAEVLPVVGVNTDISLVLLLIERAPHCFEMKHVKVCVLIEFMN